MSARVGTVDLGQFGTFQFRVTPSKFKQFIADRLGINKKDVTPGKTASAFLSFELPDFKALFKGQWKRAASQFSEFKQAFISSLAKYDGVETDIETPYGKVIMDPGKMATLIPQKLGIKPEQITQEMLPEYLEKLTLEDFKTFIYAPETLWAEIAKDFDKQKKELIASLVGSQNFDKAADAAAKPANPAAQPAPLKDFILSTQSKLLKTGESTELIKLPEGYTVDAEKTKGKKFGQDKLDLVEVAADNKSFKLKASADTPDKSEAQIPVKDKDGKDTVYKVTFSAPPAPAQPAAPPNGDKKTPTTPEPQNFWNRGWGAVITAGIAALVWIGAMATKAEKTGADVLMGIVAVVAGGAIGAKWLGGLFGAETKPTT